MSSLLILVKYHETPHHRAIRTIQSKNARLHHVPIYFLQNDPTLTTPFKLVNNTLFCRHEENYWEGLLVKVLGGLYSCQSSFQHFFVCNITTFPNIPQLLRETQTSHQIKSSTPWSYTFDKIQYRFLPVLDI